MQKTVQSILQQVMPDMPAYRMRLEIPRQSTSCPILKAFRQSKCVALISFQHGVTSLYTFFASNVYCYSNVSEGGCIYFFFAAKNVERNYMIRQNRDSDPGPSDLELIVCKTNERFIGVVRSILKLTSARHERKQKGDH